MKREKTDLMEKYMKKPMEKKIAVITSDLQGSEAVRKVLDQMQIACPVIFSGLEDLPKTAKEQVKQGAGVIIAFGMFAKIVRQNVDVPVIMVDICPEDVIEGILQAAELGKRIAIIGFRKVLHDVFLIRSLLNVELMDIPTVMPGELPEVIAGLKKDDVLVGGYYQADLARQYGIPCIVLKPRVEEIQKAISMACSYLDGQNQEAAKEKLDAAESSVYASITVDRFGSIIMMNRLASEYLGVSQLTAVSFSMEDVCPQFTRVKDVLANHRSYMNQIAKIDERTFLYHAEPVVDGEKLQGVTVTFQDVNTVLRAEASIRRKLTVPSNQARYSLDQIFGRSASMTQVLRLALKYASVDETVLILGETGVGKELFAQGIHQASARKNGPFVAINCASLPESILESELFGYVKGAFTGADREGKRGLFEQAHTGTIFLDEIGEIPMGIQGKLLRVLQERTIRRVGGEKSTPVDIRIIAATNRDLVYMVREGTFRSDLYFRINVLGLKIPPLRERREDIVPLAEEFLSEASVRNQRFYHFSENAKSLLSEYDWPGNIRELQNMVRRVTVISDGEELGAEPIHDYMEENRRLTDEKTEREDSPAGKKTTAADNSNEDLDGKQTEGKEKSQLPERKTEAAEESRLPESKTEAEESKLPERKAECRESRNGRYTLEEALAAADNNRKKAAELMGVSRATFYRMMGRKEKER